MHEEWSEIVEAVKDVYAGKEIKASFSLSERITIEVSSPYKNVNLRSWYTPSNGSRRPGWGIVLSLDELDILWKWGPVWSQFLI